MTTVLTKESSAMKQIRTTYQADQQVKYLHLEAEIEVRNNCKTSSAKTKRIKT